MATLPAYFGVKNFEKYQHYKKRNPPWIKLYYELLDDDDFILLDEVHRCRYMTLLLIAGRKNNHIPSHPESLQKLMRLTSPPDLTKLFDSEFLIASRYHRARPVQAQLEQNALSETETESSQNLKKDSSKTETETDLLSGKPDIFPSFVEQAEEVLGFLNEKTGCHYLLRNGKNGHGPLTASAKKIMARLESGYTVVQCRQVIAMKTREWGADENMEQYLRPATLFGKEKFEQYVGRLGKDDPKGHDS